MHYTNESVTIRFDSGTELSRSWLASDRQRAQRVLSNHANEGLMCLCTPTGVPMHVVKRLGAYHIATMPGRGHHHALSCSGYIPREETSGLRNYADKAISRANGIHNLSVAPGANERMPFDHFTPSSALQYLWDLAGLNVCTPKTVENRNYRHVGQSLLEASALVRINGEPIRPYIPLVIQSPLSCRTVIAQVRRVTAGRYDNAIALSADRENTFWVDEKQWECSGLADIFGPFSSPAKTRGVWIIGRLWRSPSGNYKLFDLGAISTTESFLPCTTTTKELIGSLVTKQRRFYVCLPYDAVSDTSIPAVVLIDGEAPKNLFIT